MPKKLKLSKHVEFMGFKSNLSHGKKEKLDYDFTKTFEV